LTGFPKLLSNGFQEEMKMEYLVLDKFDIDLENLFIKLNRKLKKHTIINIGIQLIDRVEKLHGLGFVHNDIKP
jgi:serine/threonine protein kinase